MPEKTTWEKQIIDAGFKAVAAKVHPDKPGGSKEAFQELGQARERLLAGVRSQESESRMPRPVVVYPVQPPDPVQTLVRDLSELLRQGEKFIKEARRRPRKR